MNLKELLNDHQMFHSTFQQDNFITGKGGTLYGAYKQCLRELTSRTQTIQSSALGIKRLDIDIEELILKVSNGTGFEKQRAEIDLVEKRMALESTLLSLSDTEREFLRFYQQAVYLKSKVGKLTPRDRAKHEAEMWEFKAKEMVVVDFITLGRVKANTYEMLRSLPKPIRLRILTEMRHQDSLIAWYEAEQEPCIPENLPEIEFSAQELIEL